MCYSLLLELPFTSTTFDLLKPERSITYPAFHSNLTGAQQLGGGSAPSGRDSRPRGCGGLGGRAARLENRFGLLGAALHQSQRLFGGLGAAEHRGERRRRGRRQERIGAARGGRGRTGRARPRPRTLEAEPAARRVFRILTGLGPRPIRA